MFAKDRIRRRLGRARLGTRGVVLLATGLLLASLLAGCASEPLPAPAATSTPFFPPEPTPEARTYEVQPGDFLSAIAARLGVPLEQLVALNNITDPTLIEVGQVLRLPPDGGSSDGTVPDGAATPVATSLPYVIPSPLDEVLYPPPAPAPVEPDGLERILDELRPEPKAAVYGVLGGTMLLVLGISLRPLALGLHRGRTAAARAARGRPHGAKLEKPSAHAREARQAPPTAATAAAPTGGPADARRRRRPRERTKDRNAVASEGRGGGLVGRGVRALGRRAAAVAWPPLHALLSAVARRTRGVYRAWRLAAVRRRRARVLAVRERRDRTVAEPRPLPTGSRRRPAAEDPPADAMATAEEDPSGEPTATNGAAPDSAAVSDPGGGPTTTPVAGVEDATAEDAAALAAIPGFASVGTSEEATRRAEERKRSREAPRFRRPSFDEADATRGAVSPARPFSRRDEAPVAPSFDPATVQLRYRAVLDLQGGALVGVEAHPVFAADGEPAPGDPLELAAPSPELSRALLEQLFDEAARFAARLREYGLKDLRIDVPVSATQLQDEELPDLAMSTLRARGVTNRSLSVRLSREALESTTERATDVVNEFRLRGVQTTLDGVCELPYKELSTIGFYQFRLDLPREESRSSARLASFVEFGRQAGLPVYAAGVVSPRDEALRERLGCTHEVSNDLLSGRELAERYGKPPARRLAAPVDRASGAEGARSDVPVS